MIQIVIIHGGDAYQTYDEYLESLKAKEVSLARLRSRDWKSNVAHDLGQGYDVLTPRMPNSQNARYLEWKIWFEKLIPLFDDSVVLIGHSLGGIFLAKYLSENNYPKKIIATFLVAAPFATPTKHPFVDFILEKSLDLFAQQGGKILLYHSKDDVVVKFEHVEMYKKELPSARVKTFTDRGHFNSESFPELLDDLRHL